MSDISNKMEILRNWKAPASWREITTIDLHTAGEPLRVFTGGLPELVGKTLLECRNYIKQNFDFLRTALMWEPRGHADMYGCLVLQPFSPEADFSVLFLHNEGYSTMCGHGIIAITTAVVESGMIPMDPNGVTVRIDTPAGLVTAHAKIKDKRVSSVSFHNVPSFVYALDQKVQVSGIGEVAYDIAFGGAFYAYVDAKKLGISCREENVTELIHKGMAIKRAVMASREITHPFEKDLGFLYGTIFIADSLSSDADNRNVCIFAEGEVDRSPTGTGVSGRVALHYKRKELALKEKMTIESIIGTSFQAQVFEECEFGGYEAIIPEVEGQAFITGRHQFLIDPNDPLKDGFILR